MSWEHLWEVEIALAKSLAPANVVKLSSDQINWRLIGAVSLRLNVNLRVYDLLSMMNRLPLHSPPDIAPDKIYFVNIGEP